MSAHGVMRSLAVSLALVVVLAWWSALACGQDEPPLLPGLEDETPSEAEEPALPEGLGGTPAGEPELPAGLSGEGEAPEEPVLPEGLTAEEPRVGEAAEGEKAEAQFPLEISGFWEMRGGVRAQDDPHEKEASIGETRLQLDLEVPTEAVTLKVTGDFLYDPVLDRHSVDLETGDGFLDLRKAHASFRPLEFMDVKVGRQILTWGTGDLIFINDLFPKDYNAFFIGRDVEYLKAPSDAVRVGFFTDLANLDIVYTPVFDADRFIDGRRISFFNTALGKRSGRDAVVEPITPDDWFEDYEVAARLYKNIAGYELAAYGYHGFWKSPAGMDPVTGRATFPELSVFGASGRGVLAKGIASVEIGYYVSADESGDDPFVRNSELRLLVGYEQEVAKDLTMGAQYEVECMMDYDEYRETLPPGATPADESRHWVTLRLTQLLMNQNLKLSLFTFYSPSDNDAYLRPNVHYKFDDHWSGEVGGNVFLGSDDHTFFGQFKQGSNVYVGLRYGF